VNAGDQVEFVVVIIDGDASTRSALENEIRQAFQDAMTIESCASPADAMPRLEAALGRKAHVPLIACKLDLMQQDGLAFFKDLRVQLPFLNSSRVLLVEGHQEELARLALAEHLISHFIVIPWLDAEIYQNLKDLMSRYILRYAYDQLPFYESIVSHHHYRKALQESEQHRVALTEQIGRFARNLLDVRSVSDHDLRKQIAEDLEQLVTPQEKSGIFKDYAAGQCILARGSPNSCLQIILEGQVQHLFLDSFGVEQNVFHEGAGAIIGSLSFFSSQPALTAVRALTPVRALSLHQSILDRAMSNNVHFLISFTNLLLRQVLSRSRKHLEINISLQQALDELKRTQLQLVESEKLVTLGQLVAGVAHELNNPAAAIVRSVDHLGSFIKAVIKDAFPLQAGLQSASVQAFNRGWELQPLSTREIRSRAQNLIPHLQSSQLAKQAVEIGLDQLDQLLQLEKQSRLAPASFIDTLHRYYQIGHFARNIEASGGRIEALVKSLKSYARQETGVFELIDVHEGIEESLLILQHRLKPFHVMKDYGSLPRIYGLPASLNQVWTNLIVNALDAMGEQGQLIIKTEYLEAARTVRISIRDSGPGIAPEIIDKIFAINFTSKRGTGFGLGLGLAICKSIVEKHQGSIAVKSEPGSYAEFIVSLPIHSPETGGES
jgi:signal transduction histidine kinase